MPGLGYLRRISLVFCVVSAGFSQTLSFNRTDISLGNDVQDVVAADFNGDGKLDLAVALYSGSIAILFGNGDGTFSAPIMTTSIGAPGQIVPASVNNDGKLDLLVGTNGSCPLATPCKFAEDFGSYTILLGNGDGTFTFGGGNSVPTFSRMAVADFTGQGPLDIFTTGANDIPTATDASCSVGQGDGMFAAPESLSGNAVGAPYVG